jgi:phage protein U
MFATLGSITFELLGSPSAYESSHRWSYAEQFVVEARPRLQWISEALQTISLELRFHAAFTDPAAELGSLLALAASHSAQALVLGNGQHQGYFVIVALRTISSVMSAADDIISMTVRLGLKEWPLDSALDPTVAVRPNFAPIAIVAAPAGETTTAVTYSGALGVASTISSPTGTYTATLTSAPGVSPILVDAPLSGASSAIQTADDVPVSAIVRSAV